MKDQQNWKADGGWAPGPWRTTGADDPRRGGILDADGKPLATTYWRDAGGEAELEANARLIAAAPDLYRALAVVYLHFDLANATGDLSEIVSAALLKVEGLP